MIPVGFVGTLLYAAFASMALAIATVLAVPLPWISSGTVVAIFLWLTATGYAALLGPTLLAVKVVAMSWAAAQLLAAVALCRALFDRAPDHVRQSLGIRSGDAYGFDIPIALLHGRR